MIALLAPVLLAALAADPPKLAPPLASVDGLPIGRLAKQALPAKGCAAYLFSTTGAKRVLVAMATADPGMLRIAIDGKTADYARTAQSGGGGFGFSGTTEYRGGDVTATLQMTITTRGDLTAGAAVPEATLRIDRLGKDSVVLPAAGLIGCV